MSSRPPLKLFLETQLAPMFNNSGHCYKKTKQKKTVQGLNNGSTNEIIANSDVSISHNAIASFFHSLTKNPFLLSPL